MIAGPITSGDLVLEFPPPGAPVSINQLRGRHHRAWTSAMAPWRDAVWVRAHNAKVRNRVPWRGDRAVRVQVTLPFAKAGRRDPHNYTGTVVKAMVDGLVHAGIVPDDTAEWVEVVDPILAVGATVVTVRVSERNPPR